MVRSTDRPAMTIAVDLGLKASRQTNKLHNNAFLMPLKYVFENIENRAFAPKEQMLHFP